MARMEGITNGAASQSIGLSYAGQAAGDNRIYQKMSAVDGCSLKLK